MEDRKHPRLTLDTMGVGNSFHIEVYDDSFELDCVHDVSVCGTGIQIPRHIEAGALIRLVYKTRDYAISVKGITVWCTPIPLGAEDPTPTIPSYRTGIQFDPGDHNCALFFMALKKYIDPFDGAGENLPML